MPSLNRCSFMGNLGRDPEMRYTASGQPVTNFSIAVNRRWRDANDEWQEETTWVNCVLWGQQAERAAENLRKGNLVYVEGRYEDDSWQDKDSGKTMHRAVFTLNHFQNLTRKEERENGGDFNPALDYAERRAGRDWSRDTSDEETAVSVAPSASGEVSRPAARPVREERADLDDLPF